MVGSTARKKTVRLETRLSPELKDKLARAADYRGCSITDFVLNSAAAAAEETIRAHALIQLSERDLQAFQDAIANPPAFDEKMREAVRRHNATVEVIW